MASSVIPATIAPAPIHVGCAGWSLPRVQWPQFPAEGTHLQRYAAQLPAVEINSSFYRPHRRETYQRWAASVPPHFRFSVKMPRRISHELRLQGAGEALAEFLQQVAGLGDKLGVLLLQLPPSLPFEAAVAEAFFHLLAEDQRAPVICEPRHATWFQPEATALLRRVAIARAAADPAPVPAAALPGACQERVYYRLHGSPRMYHSAYGNEFLQALAATLSGHCAAGQDTWCIFDNTAEGAALANALALRNLLEG
ncbi:MAG: hypothetical protein K0S46_1231 [Moraxellaceae bacterium]|jgi:uncharacterized protein YecE (DUF72 family)|nr:hypothetical protein [Moraxellaceae bacterium]